MEHSSVAIFTVWCLALVHVHACLGACGGAGSIYLSILSIHLLHIIVHKFLAIYHIIDIIAHHYIGVPSSVNPL